LAVLEDARFQAGDFDTHFLETIDLSARHRGEDELVAAAAAIFRHDKARRRALSPAAGDRGAWVARSRAEWSRHAARSARSSGSTDGAGA
jgi:hypothetical protein